MGSRTLRKFLFPQRLARAEDAARRALPPVRSGAAATRRRRGDVTTFHRCLALHMVSAERTGALS